MDTLKETKKPDSGWTQHYDVMKELGDCYLSVGDYEQAGKCYEKAATLGPDEAGPYIGMGVLSMQEGRLPDAEVAFRVARRLDPENSKAYCGLGLVCQQKEQLQEAFDFYLKCLELDNNNLTGLLGLFQTSCKMGSFAKVIYYLEVYLDMHPGDCSVMFCLAALYFKDGSTEKAREVLLDIRTLEPENKDAANLLEEVEHALGQKS